MRNFQVEGPLMGNYELLTEGWEEDVKTVFHLCVRVKMNKTYFKIGLAGRFSENQFINNKPVIPIVSKSN